MDFTFTEEQRLMASAFRELADEICSAAELRAAFEGKTQRAAERWARLSQIGLPGVLAPESAGGLGLAPVDFALIAEESGRAALPEPLCEHAGVAVPLLAEFKAQGAVAALLPRAASGERLLAVDHEANPFALVGEPASHVIVCRGEELHLHAIAEAHVVLEPSSDALRRLARIEAPAGPRTLIARGAAVRAASARAFERGALFAACECAGLAERMIQIGVAYARERQQFGKPIGSYQAIKHQFANAQLKLEFARPMIYLAASRADAASPRARALVSAAKLAATEAADLAARTSMQAHGAMGYSWEVDLHFYMKRAWALAGAWGDRNFHARRVQSLVLGGAIALGPDQTFET